MKKLLLTLFATALSVASYSQCSIKEVPLTSRISSSSDVIEGQVIAKNSFWNTDHTMIYTANTIEVYKVFKGAISSRTIEIITQGGTVNMDRITAVPSLELNIDEVGIFTCEPVSHVRANPAPRFGIPQFEAYGSMQGFIKYDLPTQTASDPFTTYTDIQTQLFDVLSLNNVNGYTEIQQYDYRNHGSSTQRNGPQNTQSVTITSFSPTTITAGTNTVLTINGSGFGSTQNSGTVGFKNADDGGATYINPLQTQILSWSNTQITVEVPSNAGTGTIQVTQGTTATSAGTLTISWANLNVDFDPGTGTVAYQTDHVDMHGTGGYIWKMNPGFDGNVPARAAFMRAFDSWRCSTGINWTIGSTTSINDAVSDGTNVICFDNTAPLPAGVLGVCYSYWSGCASGPNIVWYVNELDIIFDEGSNLTTLSCTWDFGPSLPTISQYDFETVAVHELGHGHQLGHVINNGAIMHYAISNGASNRTPGVNDLAGANFVQAKSIVANVCGPGPITSYSCASPPVAAFTGTPTALCAGGTVAFTDQSTNTPTSWSWTFTGGTPSTSSSQNPTVTYNTPGSYAVSLTATNASGSDVQTNNGYITVHSNPVASASSQTNISCNGGGNGAATVSVTGGTPSYSYNWTPGNPTGDGTVTVTGLTVQTYTCTVTDANSCTDTQTFSITQPSAISLTANSQTNISCNGAGNGAASVNAATGGAGGYTYNWTPGNPTGDGTTSVTGLTAQTYTCTVTDANGCTATRTFAITQPAVLVASALSQTNISCNGGSNGTASVSVSGGTTTYSFNWTPGNPVGDGTASVSGLGVGTYTCTVTDANGCTDTQTFSITQPAALVASALSQTNISCNGGNNGAASVSVSGGTTAYSFNWTPGNPTGDGTASVSGLTAQNYTCTVTDANGCTDTQTFNITAPSAISSSAVSTPSACAGNTGSATVTASGGTGSLTYSWAPSGGNAAAAINLSAGNYTCTITDANSCTATQTVTVGTTSGPSASISSQTNVTCNASCNGSATVFASGGAGGYTYSWTSGGTAAAEPNLCAGSYTCTVTDAASCTAIATVTITQPSAITSSISSQTNVSCNGGSNGSATVSPSGGTPSYTFSWAPSGGNAATASGLTSGNYTCTITDANGCTHAQTVSITQPSALIVSASNNSPICNGANATLTGSASGGTAAYTFNWMPGSLSGSSVAVSPSSNTTYTVTGTDANGCINTSTTLVTVNALPTVGFTVNPASGIVCSGNPVTLSGTGASSYVWSGGITNAVAFTPVTTTTYTVTGTDLNGCQNTASELITVNNCGGSHLTPAYCGFTENLLTDNILYTATANATNYRIRVSNPSLGYSQVFVRGNYLTNFNMNLFSGILYNKTYNVDISAYVGTAWGGYGNICTVTTPAGPPLPQLTNPSCGMTGVTHTTNLYYSSVAGATNYRIRITCPTSSYNHVFTRGNNATYFLLSSFPGILPSTTYNVEIAAFVSNAWGSYGTICSITTGSALRFEFVSSDSTDTFSLNVYPNPTSDVLHLDASAQINAVIVYSITGQLVSTYGKVDEISMIDLEPGTYIVEVQTETGTKRTLVIKE